MLALESRLDLIASFSLVIFYYTSLAMVIIMHVCVYVPFFQVELSVLGELWHSDHSVAAAAHSQVSLDS